MADRPSGSIDPKLLEILVCPLTKRTLEYDRRQAGTDLARGASSPTRSATASRSCCRTKRASSMTILELAKSAELPGDLVHDRCRRRDTAKAGDDDFPAVAAATAPRRATAAALRPSARPPARSHVLQQRHAIDDAEPDVAHEAQQRRAVGEQPVQPVGGDPHRHRCRSAASARSAPAPPALPGSSPSRAASTTHSASAADVLQPEIEALTRDRMNHMRGVADQRESLGDEATRHEIASG